METIKEQSTSAAGVSWDSPLRKGWVELSVSHESICECFAGNLRSLGNTKGIKKKIAIILLLSAIISRYH